MSYPVAKSTIDEIIAYKGGLSKASGGKTIKLSSNETPLGASPKAIEAYKNYFDQLHKYPPHNDILAAEIAKIYHLNAANIVIGAGSDELISLLCLAYAGDDTEILYSKYGFLMYAISAKTVGATPIAAEEQNLRVDVEALVKNITKKTKIIFIANPNNPTGSYITRQELQYLRDNTPGHILIVLDGAYAEYLEKDDYSAGEDFVENSDNIVMLRTFSKIYGLANLRVGCGYCPPKIAETLNKVRGPFNVSGVGLNCAIEAVNDIDHIKKSKQHNDKWLAFLEEKIQNLGLEIHPSSANFVLVKFTDKTLNAANADKFLLKHGLIGRPLGSYGLNDHIRFTVGKKDENEYLIKILEQFLK